MISILRKPAGKKSVLQRDLRLLSESSLVLIASGNLSQSELRIICSDLLAERGLDESGEYTGGAA